MGDRRDPLPALTALRFLAAAAVLTLHLVALPYAEPVIWVNHFWWGTAGVTFFFMLSGFILTYNYHDRFRQLTFNGVRDFYAARFARIWPVHLLGFLLILPLCTDGQLLLAGGYMKVRWKAVVNLGLAQSFVPSEPWLISYNAPSWSLSAEWFFYLCFPFLLWGWVVSGWRGRALIAAAACGCWATAMGLSLGHDPAVLPLKWFGYFFPPTRLFDFFIGCVLGWMMTRRQGLGGRGSCRAAGPGSAGASPSQTGGSVRLHATLLEALAIASVVLAVQVAPYRSPEDMFLFSWCGYFTLPFAAVIWVFARGRGHLSALLSRRVPVYLGEVSYAVYMLHLPALLTVSSRAKELPFAWKAVLTVALTLAASMLCYHIYEMPLRDWLRRQLSSRRGPKKPTGTGPVLPRLPLPAPRL